MLGLLEFLENWIKKTELKYTDLRAEGAKVGVFQFTPTFAPKARSPPASTRPSSLSCVLDILCICTIYMYLLDVSIRYLKYFCVLFVLFVYAVSFIAMLHLHLWWFYLISVLARAAQWMFPNTGRKGGRRGGARGFPEKCAPHLFWCTHDTPHECFCAQGMYYTNDT